MEFRDLRKQYEVLKPEIDEAVINVFKDASFIHGKQVVELEQELAKFVDVKHCITCANGTDALQLALMCWGIGKGDAVFVPDFTFFSSGEAPAALGATPVFVDVDDITYNMSVSSLEKAIQCVIQEGMLKPRVVIAVDLFGQPANYDEIKKVADKYNLLVLEDGAQGFGGSIWGKRACSFGDISTTSFFPAKPLGCYGDGGAIFTNHDEWAALLRSLCVHGKGRDKYDNVTIGMNSRLDTVQAAILQIKLKAFMMRELDTVNTLAAIYTEKLRPIVTIPAVREGFLSSWAQYTIQLRNEEERNLVQSQLKNKGIPSMIYYVKPLHLQRAFTNGYLNDINGKLDFQNTEKLCKTVLSLPIHPYLREEDIKSVVDIIYMCIR